MKFRSSPLGRRIGLWRKIYARPAGETPVKKNKKTAVPANHSVLFIGHSHVSCIAQAAQGKDNIEVINLRKDISEKISGASETVAAVLDKVTLKKPDAVCLCIRGNAHSIWGLAEHPFPFSIGDAHYGSVPQNGSGRQIIPYELMKERFEVAYPAHFNISLYEAFPFAKRYCLDASPPVADWSKVEVTPGGYFGDPNLGPAPDDLRLKLYQVQRDVLRERATLDKAVFVSARTPLIDERGFLTDEYHDTDPTHGNEKYGRAMLKRICDMVGEQS